MKLPINRYCNVSESIEESLKQMKSMRDGKMYKKSWKEFRKELQDSKLK